MFAADRLFQIVDSGAQLNLQISQNPALAVWFSGSDCGVCRSLKPKLEELFSARFPAVRLVEVNCAELPEIAASHLVFSVPTLIIFLEGRESLREGRNIALSAFSARLQRSYDLLFQ